MRAPGWPLLGLVAAALTSQKAEGRRQKAAICCCLVPLASYFLLPTAFCLLAAGCSSAPAPPKRGKLYGKVTLDGKPVAKATIRFIALEAGGVNVLAAVKDGAYEVPEGQGPVKGKYRVEFSVPSASVRRIPNPDIPGEWLSEPAETLPARYHRDSTYVLDYDPDNPKPYNAELTSR